MPYQQPSMPYVYQQNQNWFSGVRIKPKFHYANFATKSETCSWQSRGLVADTNHESPWHKSRRRLSWLMSETSPQLCRKLVPKLCRATLSPTLPVHCSKLEQHKRHGLCRKHLNMLRWFVSATFAICVGDFHRNFMVSWFVTVCFRDFHDLCPRLSPQGSFGESRRNGIWALATSMSLNTTADLSHSDRSH